MANRRRVLLLDTLLPDALILSSLVVLALPIWSQILGDRINLRASQSLPSWSHPLGTDHLGRDLLVRLSSSLVDAVLPLWATSILAAILGAAMAIFLAALSTSDISNFVMRSVRWLATIVGAVPLTIATFALAVFFEEANLKSIVLALAAVIFFQSYLQMQDRIKESHLLGYWTAHEALGGHIIQRIWIYGVRSTWTNELTVALGMQLRAAVIVEATLSYLGFGIQEPSASFGNILAAHFAESLHGKWWVMAVTLATLLLTALAPRTFIRIVTRALNFRHFRARQGFHALPTLTVSTLPKQVPTTHR